jgi:hypothetical protein
MSKAEFEEENIKELINVEIKSVLSKVKDTLPTSKPETAQPHSLIPTMLDFGYRVTWNMLKRFKDAITRKTSLAVD